MGFIEIKDKIGCIVFINTENITTIDSYHFGGTTINLKNNDFVRTSEKIESVVYRLRNKVWSFTTTSNG
jgi:hypothetical protein